MQAALDAATDEQKKVILAFSEGMAAAARMLREQDQNARGA